MASDPKQLQHDQWYVFADGYSHVVLDQKMMQDVHDAYAAALVPRLKDVKGARVLDVAAACGEPSVTLAKQLPDATFIATDLAENYHPLLRHHCELEGVKNVTFEAADGENLALYADNSFDAVTCSLGLMFFPQEKQGLAEFWRVLKPGGFMAVTVWGSSVPFFQLAASVSAEIAPPPPGAQTPVLTAMRFGDASKLCTDIAAAGFVDVDHTVLNVTFKVSNDGEGGWWGRLWQTPFPMKNAIATAVAAGRTDAEAEARAALQAVYAGAGFIVPGSGDLEAPGNDCHFIIARKT